MIVPQKRRLSTDSSSEYSDVEDEEASRAAADRQDTIAMDLAGRSHTGESVLSHYLRFGIRTPEEQEWMLTCLNDLRNSETVKEALQVLHDSDAQWQEDQKWWETEICSSLDQLFDEIRNFCGASRMLCNTHSAHIATEDPLLPGSTYVKPDFVLRDQQHYNTQTASDTVWRDVLACVKVNSSRGEAPHPDLSDELSPAKIIIAQVGDYSRIHLAQRPFQLFSISLLIYGPFFNISVFDRGGVLHSPQMVMYDDDGLTPDFVFVVKRLLQDLTPTELGQEPDVELVRAGEGDNAQDNLSYPCFRVPALPGQPAELDPGHWTTDGRPIWTSQSLVGRGTTVWKVTAGADTSNRAYIMKSAWRCPDRPSETAIYAYLRERHLTGARGIADFLAGADVVLRCADSTASLSVNALRPPDARAAPDLLLHRVLLPHDVRPLWQFDGPAHFVRALLAVVKGIGALAEHGILHRDLSIGNVLLSADPREGHEAFLTDFDSASIREWEAAASANDDSQGQAASVEREPHMTSTLQFMAVDMLWNALTRYDEDWAAFQQSGSLPAGSSTPPPVEREVKHDLESLIWVADCALHLRAFETVAQRPETDAQRTNILAALQQAYGPATVSEILRARCLTLSQIIMPPPPRVTRPVDHVLRAIERPLASIRTMLLLSVCDQNARPAAISDDMADVVQERSLIGRTGKPLTCTALEDVLRLALQYC